jgi:Tyrosyl-DNA phosphodiesterase
MSVESFGWKSLLVTDAPATCRLQHALLTSYDQPGARFLVEHFLPLLLSLDRDAGSEGIERQYFFGELTRRLEALHGRLVVISSMSQTEDGDPDYPWLWRFVRPLAVGSTGKAVQHAKLWMLHWATEDEDQEYLELVISSANLTLSAFKGQIQGAWRVCVPLASRGSLARRASWGILPAFLQELGVSCNEQTSFTPFIELLARAECPANIHFVASVPGVHSPKVLKRTPWGAAGLAGIAPAGKGRVVASVLAPYVGTWNTVGLEQWCNTFGGKPADIELVWIDKDHPWARGQCWVLPKKTLQALEEAGCEVLHLRYEPVEGDDDVVRFHNQHRGGDDRWSHAKAYQFRRGNSRRLLITSANFSAAAWGRSDEKGGLSIENFELGVCVQAEPWPFARLAAFEDFDGIATVSEEPSRSAPSLTWASASWDGKRVRVECRVAHAKLVVAGDVSADDRRQKILRWDSQVALNLRSTNVPWLDAKNPPHVATLTCNDESLEVPVFDTRERGDRMTTPVPEVDEDQSELMRDELLFEQYGGRAASDTIDPGKDVEDPDLPPDHRVDGQGIDNPEQDDASATSDSYAVATFEHARISLEIVDTWASRIAGARDRSEARRDQRLLYEDGEALLAAFERQVGRLAAKSTTTAIGPRLAAEELRLRLKHVEDES